VQKIQKGNLEPTQSASTNRVPLGLNDHLTDTCVAHFVRLASTNCVKNKIGWYGGQKCRESPENLTNPQII